LYLVAERKLRQWFSDYRPGPFSALLLGLLTYVLVNLTWVFFRAKSFHDAWQILGGMVGANGGAAPILPTMRLVTVALIIAAIVCAHWRLRQRTLEEAVSETRPWLLAGALGLMLFAIVIAQGEGNAFIYFQF
jgi:alginate O-acetyltransferase complex protein AlgI